MFTHTYQESQAYQQDMHLQASRERQIRELQQKQTREKKQGRTRKGFLQNLFSL